MKILLDARKINDFGIGEYIKNVFGPISASNLFEDIILHHPDKPAEFVGNNSYIPIYSQNYNFFEQLEIPLKTFRTRNSLYFSPHYIYPLFMSKKLIVTVHDLTHFKFPEFFKPKIKISIGEYFLKKIRDNAKKIFTVSYNTKRDMIDMFDFKSEQITVIHNGLNNDFFNTKKEKSPMKNPYILYTGNIKPHKNVLALIEAFKIIHPLFKDLKLALIGAGEKIPETFIHEEIGDNIISTGYLTRKRMINYIDNAEIFIFPSFYEGFGYPPLEAMARRKAVISSPEGSLKEILGDAALYFNPHSPEDLAEKITAVLTNKKMKKTLEDKSEPRAKLFTLDKSVTAYLNELQKIKI